MAPGVPIVWLGTGRTAGHPQPAGAEQPLLAHPREDQRGNREVQAADAQRDRAQQHRRRHAGCSTEERGHRKPDPELPADHAGDEGAQAHEGGLRQGDLANPADQDDQRDGHQRVLHRPEAGPQHGVGHDPRHDRQDHERDGRPGDEAARVQPLEHPAARKAALGLFGASELASPKGHDPQGQHGKHELGGAGTAHHVADHGYPPQGWDQPKDHRHDHRAPDGTQQGAEPAQKRRDERRQHLQGQRVGVQRRDAGQQDAGQPGQGATDAPGHRGRPVRVNAHEPGSRAILCGTTHRQPVRGVAEEGEHADRGDDPHHEQPDGAVADPHACELGESLREHAGDLQSRGSPHLGGKGDQQASDGHGPDRLGGGALGPQPPDEQQLDRDPQQRAAGHPQRQRHESWHANRLDQRVEHVRGQGGHGAMGEVEHAGGAVDRRDPQGKHGVGAHEGDRQEGEPEEVGNPHVSHRTVGRQRSVGPASR